MDFLPEYLAIVIVVTFVSSRRWAEEYGERESLADRKSEGQSRSENGRLLRVPGRGLPKNRCISSAAAMPPSLRHRIGYEGGDGIRP
jgi:hypothetical protein